MKILQNILESIGNTPLVKLNKIAKGFNVLAKLESANPGGSIKDRIALNMIEDAESRGLLHDGTTVIEPTSGNTGVGLAMVCAAKGYKLILTMPESMSVERRNLLKAYGAELILTPANLGMKGAIDKAELLLKAEDNAFMPQQFNNLANPDIHYKITAQEIWQACDGVIDIFIAGIGTGGSISGIGKFLKEKSPNIKIIGIEPEDSAVLSGKKAGAHSIQGIGAGFVPNTLNLDLLDEVKTVTNQQAIKMATQLVLQEGILSGISSGANIAGAMDIAKLTINKDKTIVSLLPDTGERYLSTGIFD